MAVITREEFQAIGGWTAEVDYRASLLEEFLDADRNPRNLLAFIYDAEWTLAYSGILLRVAGGKAGLTIGGHGRLWNMGAGEVGPRIAYREYVAGTNRLNNGDLDLEGGLYWRRKSQDSLWEIADGVATNAGDPPRDDVLEYGLEIPTVPGRSYRVQALGVIGFGRLRLRTLYKGRFNPANRLLNSDFEDASFASWGETANITLVPTGGRTGPGAMRVAPIPQPQSVTNPDFEMGGAGWVGAYYMDVITDPANARTGNNVLRLTPNPQPQYIEDPGFETGAGWTDVSEFITDMDVVVDPANARTGSGVMRVGPVTEKQILINGDMATGSADHYSIDYWHETSIDSLGATIDPDEVWYHDAPIPGIQATWAATTDASTTPGRAVKYLRSDSTNGGGTDPYAVVAGEEWEAEAQIRAAQPGTDGTARLALVYPHPSLEPQYPRWNHSTELHGDQIKDEQFRVLKVRDRVPPGRTRANVLIEILDHTSGFWAVDEVKLTRIGGNRAQINHDYNYGVVADTRYRLAADVRAGGAMQGGSVRVGVILRGDGMPDLVEDVDKGSTDYVWSRVNLEFRPPAGYTSAQPFVAALDILGDPVWVDNVTLSKIENNTDVIQGTPFDVVTDQRYLLNAAVRSGPGSTRGRVRIGVRLNGPGLPALDYGRDQGLTTTWAGVPLEFRPPEGYETATPYVQSTDIEGDYWWVDSVTVHKVDNNSDSSGGASFAVIPERAYRWTMAVRSGPNLQRGTVKLSVTCTRAGHEDVVFNSGAMDATTGAWEFIDFTFTPPSGYSLVTPRVVATDVEGDYYWVDDGMLVDASDDTHALDTWVDSPTGTTVSMDTTAPEGAEYVRCQLVLEQGAGPYHLEGVSLARIGVTPATGDDIAADLLTDMDTGVHLLLPGVINCPEVIPSDWEVINLTNRAAWDHWCSVVSVPRREYRVNVDGTVDVGASEDVFGTKDVMLLPEDVDVVDTPNISVDAVDRPTEVEVIGAEVQTVTGQTVLIQATAPVPGAPRVDERGNPLRRGKQVSDGTVDHVLYAQALAEDLAAQEAAPPLSITVGMSGADRPGYGPGDWIGVYNPEGGVQDLSNPVSVAGRTVFPRRVRVFSRGRSLPSGCHLVIRREDGSTFEVPGVTWSDEEATVLTVGDHRPKWQRNPQGLSAGEQYLRDRAAKPR